MIHWQQVFQNCRRLISWTPMRSIKMEFWTRMPSCVYFCVADKDVKSWPSSNPLSLRVVAGWNAEQTEEDESFSSTFVPHLIFHDIFCQILYSTCYIVYDTMIFLCLSYQDIERCVVHEYINTCDIVYDTMIILCLRITTRRRKMCHWTFSSTFVPHLIVHDIL